MFRHDLDDKWLREHCDTETIELMGKMLYELIHVPMNDMRRLEKLVMCVWGELNRLYEMAPREL